MTPEPPPTEQPSQGLVGSLRLLARVCAEVSAILGAGVLLGWAFDVGAPTDVHIPNLVGMKVDTAAFFLATGLAARVLASVRSGPRLRRAARWAGALVALAALAALFGHATGAGLHPDGAALREASGAVAPSDGGRVAPGAAAAFVLLGLALLFHDVETLRGGRPSQLLALAAALVPVQALIGYAYGIEPLFATATAARVALHTGIGLALLCTSLLFSRPDSGVMRVFTGAGLAGLMARRMVGAILLLPPALGWLFLVAGLRLGRYETILGASFVVVSAMVLGAAVVWWNAVALGALEAERSRAEQTEREQRERLRTTLGSIGDAVIAADTSGRVMLVNAVAESLTGWRQEEAVGHLLEEVFHALDDDARGPVAGPLGRALRERVVAELPPRTRVVSRAGGERPVGGSVAPIQDERGRTLGVVLAFHDVSERRRIESERARILAIEQAARTEAEAASRTKDEFIATVSHELRTPLNAVLGWARLLRSGRLDPEAIARAIEAIERSATTQAQIVDDLLDVSRITRGQLRLDVRAVELTPVIEAAIDTVRPAAAAKNIAVAASLAARAGPVQGDPGRLQQVVWNLLANAIKFTSPGGRVEVRLEQVREGVRIRVQDTGAGIPAEFLPHVFERFRQADQSSTRAHGGLGLGLAIARHLVEAHGGTVSAESPGPGRGATFTVLLPAQPVRAVDGAPPSGATEPPPPTEPATSTEPATRPTTSPTVT